MNTEPEPGSAGPALGRLAVFGAYSDSDLYQRNRVLVDGATQLSDSFVVVRPSGAGDHAGFFAGRSAFQRARGLLVDLWSLWRQRGQLRDCDTIFVPYPAYLVVILLRLSGLRKQRRLVVDAFLELRSTLVDDRQLLKPDSLRMRLLDWLQRQTIGRADLALMDTPAHAAVLARQLRESATAIAAVPVGIDETLWPELEHSFDDSKPLSVLFWGTFIPLHGVESIVRAAVVLESRGVPVRFHFVGDGQTAAEMADLIGETGCERISWERCLLDTEALQERAREADVILGVFGASEKAAAVVPYKVQQALALGRPVVTRENEELRPLDGEGDGLVLVPPSDPEALAQALVALRERLSDGWRPATRRIFDVHFSRAAVRRALAEALQHV